MDNDDYPKDGIAISFSMFIFDCVVSSLPHTVFLKLCCAGSASKLCCAGFFCSAALAPGHEGFSSCCTQAQ